MAGFKDEFKEFISKGNVMDMAVGIIIGGAFTAIVTSLCTNIINPLIQLITKAAGGDNALSALVFKINEDCTLDFAAFISAIINFLLIALVVFFLVKALNKVQSYGKKEEAEAEEFTCPHCLEEIKEGASRCPHCAGEIAAS